MMRPIVTHARILAAGAHRNQMYEGQPYMVHLEAVVAILREFGYGEIPELIAAGYLHDVVEDAFPDDREGALNAIRTWFGDDVGNLVWTVTDEPGANRMERHLKTYPKIRRYGWQAVALKLADRIANTEACVANGNSKLKMYRKEFADFSTMLYDSADDLHLMWDRLRKATGLV